MKCHVCGKPATCVGVYENPDDPPRPACDDCCGHGNEDGWCTSVTAFLLARPDAHLGAVGGE